MIMKKALYIFLTLCLALSLFGCAGKTDDNTTTGGAKPGTTADSSAAQPESRTDTEKEDAKLAELCKSAKDKIKFSSELEDQGSAPLYSYSMDSAASDAAGWCAMAGTDQIAVFKIKDGMENEAQKKARAYVDYLIDGYSSYGPEEVPKLRKAIIKNYSGLLVVCITDDSGAQKTLDSVFSK